MRYTNIMVPYDGSVHAQSALETAKEFLADNPTARLHVITVVTSSTVAPPINADYAGFDGAPLEMLDYSQYQDFLRAALDRAQEAMTKSIGDALNGIGDRAVVQAIVSSSPAVGITDYATDHGCDLIIMGRRGLGALRGMLGSVSFAVLRSAEIPVLTVK